MASQKLPKLLFVGAGNIAQSIIKGILKARPNANDFILATAPSSINLNILKEQYNCKTTLLDQAHNHITEFKPDFVFLCFKPQVFLKSLEPKNQETPIQSFLKKLPNDCTTLSLLAGVGVSQISSAFSLPEKNVVRVMLNTAAEIGSTSVLYYTLPDIDQKKIEEMEELFSLVGKALVKLNDESLMDVGTGLCGSGIAFFYEMIQTISDIGVKNGLNRTDATLIAAQLSKAAGEMILEKKSHPYKLRDDVTSPAGTTIYGISSWHEHSTSNNIGKAFQASIDRAQGLSEITKSKIRQLLESPRW